MISIESKRVSLRSENDGLVASLQDELKNLKEEMAQLKNTQVSCFTVVHPTCRMKPVGIILLATVYRQAVPPSSDSYKTGKRGLPE